MLIFIVFFFFSSRRRHTRLTCDWSSDVCSSDLTAPGRNEYEGVLAALAGSDRKAALALVTDLMSIAGTTNVGGRTVDEIADRFLEQSTLKSGVLPRDALATIKRFLAIAGDPDEAV